MHCDPAGAGSDAPAATSTACDGGSRDGTRSGPGLGFGASCDVGCGERNARLDAIEVSFAEAAAVWTRFVWIRRGMRASATLPAASAPPDSTLAFLATLVGSAAVGPDVARSSRGSTAA